MTSAIEQIDDTTVKLTVTLSEDDLAPAIAHAYEHIGEQVNIPGFRKGKVPAKLLEQRVGRPAALQHAIEETLPQWYADAIAENDVRPFGQPEIDLVRVPGQEEGDETLEFTATVETRPEVKLPKIDGITLEVSPIEVEDADVEARLTTLRERFGTLVTVDRPAKDGDYVTLDLSASIDGNEVDTVQGTSYQVGSGNMLEGLDEAVTGLTGGEETTYEGPLAAGDHAGEKALVTVKVTAVKERELPVADDDFAQLASEFDTVAELRDDLREQAAKIKKQNQAVEARGALLDHLRDNTEFALPKKVIEQEVHQHLEGENRLDDDVHRAEVTEEAQQALTVQILLDQLADDLEIEVQENELLDYLLNASRQYGMDPNTFIEQVQSAGQIPAMVAEVARSKATAYALRRVTVKDTAGAAVDLKDIIGDEATDAERAAAAASATPDN